MVRKFRKKPVVIDALQVPYDLETATNNEFFEHLRTMGANHPYPVILPMTDRLEIRTLEGVMEAMPGDWIIKGIKGEFYPCKPYIFDATYEPVE